MSSLRKCHTPKEASIRAMGDHSFRIKPSILYWKVSFNAQQHNETRSVSPFCRHELCDGPNPSRPRMASVVMKTNIVRGRKKLENLNYISVRWGTVVAATVRSCCYPAKQFLISQQLTCSDGAEACWTTEVGLIAQLQA